jgi:hypothetical protein
MQRGRAAGLAAWQNGQMWKAWDSIRREGCNRGATDGRGGRLARAC